MKNTVHFLAAKDFLPSLKILMQKGGAYQKAGQTVQSAWGRANSAGEYSYDQVFAGIPTTNHGENRIAHCVKFDLTAYSRLVTAYSNNICIFLFAGDHNAVDAWLDKNKGLDFIAQDDGKSLRVEPVFVSNQDHGKHGLIQSPTDWMSNGPVLDQLHPRYQGKLLASLDSDVIDDLKTIESHTDEDTLLETTLRVPDHEQREAILDVLLALRSSDLVKAKNRIDLYEKSAKPVAELTEIEATKIVSGENIIRVQDVDPILFDHFVKTADFKDWMLYLHPAQRDIISRDFNGPARLAGVSGSGKTCVVIHRALRLARELPENRVLVLTLNAALAKLINELIDAESGLARPANITVTSVFDLCRERLVQLVPNKKAYYGKKTVANNGFATSEHIDEIWDEYFHCENNNLDAEVLHDVSRTLLVRTVFPQDYLRQEFDYVRSAFSPIERPRYLDMERLGRVIPLERRYREMVLRGLAGWEAKMDAVGAIDDSGIVTALYDLLYRLNPEYDHVLVDEVQDLGTLELKIIRRLTKPGKNDLFLCGDAAQTVHTKFTDLKAAEIDLPSARWIKINQNYRNSRQILTAAQTVLTRSFSEIPPGTVDIEIISPEYANFSSAKPLLLKAASIDEEISMALAFAESYLAEASKRKACIALCGYAQPAVEELAQSLDLHALSGSTDLSTSALFLSDLEQTKGFEFDLVIVLNCRDRVIPHPELPQQESFRELCKLYVALTRAKTELIVSCSGTESRFVAVAKDEYFNVGQWSEHVDKQKQLNGISLPTPALRRIGNTADWAVSGKAFLRLREAVGLSAAVQDEILAHVTGNIRTQQVAGGSNRRQIEWKEFSSFFQDMESAQKRNLIISDQAWAELKGKLGPLLEANPPENAPPLPGREGERIPNKFSEQHEPSNYVALHRHEGILSFSVAELSAHTLASLLVVHGANNLEELEIGKPLDRKALEFLIPKRVMIDWLAKKRLREVHNNPNALTLTKAGADEAIRRISIAEDPANRSASSVAVSMARVAKCREIILLGQSASPTQYQFVKRQFKL